jgi:hypothetical protein
MRESICVSKDGETITGLIIKLQPRQGICYLENEEGVRKIYLRKIKQLYTNNNNVIINELEKAKRLGWNGK